MEAGSLFPYLVGELLSDLKLGCRLAHQIEEDLIRQGWPAGIIYGTETELTHRFQVGRKIVREAARVLEVRGSARMRPGPKGGLQVLRPSRTQSVEMAAEYIQLLGLAPAKIREARVLLDNVQAEIARSGLKSSREFQQIEHIALPFFKELMEVTERLPRQSSGAASADRSTRPLFHRSRAGQVARRLMTECTQQQWLESTRLGSTFELCERFRIDRSVLRQAIRILESAGMAVSLSGRGHGLVTRAPRQGPVCRLISCHFAGQGLSANAAMTLFRFISLEAVGRLAELALPRDIARIENALDALANAPTEKVNEAVFEAEESQFATLHNPIIDVFLNSTKAFTSWHISESFTAANNVYLAETRKVAAAIARHDRPAAAAAQDLKFHRMAESFGYPWRRAED
jgi:DNA-binding FadR family transcriptional regulator